MIIEFVEAEVVDQDGALRKVYHALYSPIQMSSEEITREIAGARPQLGRLNIVRRAVLDLDGLDDMESAKVLVLAILSKMRALQWPQETSPESLLFAIVNEAVHTLEKTAADFLLTEDSPADSLKS